MAQSSALQRAVERASVTRRAILADDALDRLAEVVGIFLAAGPIMVVCDDNTWTAAGREVEARLAGSGREVAALVLQGRPRLKAKTDHSAEIAARLQASGASPVAVGAGVINDLTKHAASLAGRPYVCVPTAASMDGYSASGAALLHGGFKQTMACPPPVAVVADPRIAAAAPSPMASWGYADLAGKISAGGDWIVADALGEEAISQAEWDLVQGNLGLWLKDPLGVRDRDPAAIRGLLEGLLMSGFAMQSYGTSRPASGSDHQFSHMWEMEGLAVGGVPVSHGACVGVGCLASLALYDWLIRQDLTAIDVDALVRRRPPLAETEREVRAAFADPHLAECAIVEVRAKHPDDARLRSRLVRLQATWPELCQRLARHLPRAASVRETLAVQSLPVHPSDLGIALPAFAVDYRRAAMIRRRYTIFDLLIDIGRFDEAVAATMAAGGFWDTASG